MIMYIYVVICCIYPLSSCPGHLTGHSELDEVSTHPIRSAEVGLPPILSSPRVRGRDFGLPRS